MKPSKPKPKAASAPIRITIPCLSPPVSHQISRLVKNKANIDVTFSNNKTIKTLLHANGRGTSCSTPKPRGCVYQILCGCGDTYIGETLRPLRLKEHRASVNKLDLISAVSEHISKNQDHAIIWEATKALSVNNSNWRQRKLQEAIDIRRSRPAINCDQGTHLPSAWDLIILE
ncbi:uncharacterized protein [Haliotis asinina]|uniref:uncharacterized protein n=1 Tax=Haliotis asinina TaxID=109174 RepID=UPI0035319ADF